ncbi:MAG: tetratricopeptide repeat protein [Candidatus Obscuribacterales bacterium]|nr:tetratricopeptide repeat protein [Candidatus Obscuribacterales bacterium]
MPSPKQTTVFSLTCLLVLLTASHSRTLAAPAQTGRPEWLAHQDKGEHKKIKAAIALFEEGKTKAAMPLLKGLLQAHKENQRLRYFYILGLSRLNKREEAFSQLDAFLQKDPSDPEALLLKASLVQDPKEANSLKRKALDLGYTQDCLDQLNALGGVNSIQRKDKAAGLIKKYPFCPAFQIMQGIALFAEMEYEEACLELEKAAVRSRALPGVQGFCFMKKAEALNCLGKSQEAIESASQSINLFQKLEQSDRLPQFLSADLKVSLRRSYDLRAAALSAKGEYTKAAQDLEKAMAINPDKRLLTRATCLANRAGQYQKALQFADMAIQKQHGEIPDELGAERIKALAGLNRHAEAIKAQSEMLLKSPNDSALLAERASELIKLGRYREAILDLNKVLQEKDQKDSIRCLEMRALAYRKSNMTALAVADEKKIASLKIKSR